MKSFIVIMLALVLLPGVVVAQSCGPFGCGPVGSPWSSQVGWPQLPYEHRAMLTVEVDDPSAEIWVQGVSDWIKLPGFGKERQLAIQNVVQGAGYRYSVRVRWLDGTVDERDVSFTGGQSPRISFWLASVGKQQKPIFGLSADKMAKPGDPTRFEFHTDGGLIEAPANSPRDTSKQGHIVLIGKSAQVLAKPLADLEQYKDQVKITSYDLSNPLARWAVHQPYKLDQDKRFQASGFKASFLGPLNENQEAEEFEAIYDPNRTLDALRKTRPDFDPSKTGGGLGLPPWLAKYFDGIDQQTLVVGGAIVVLFLFVLLVPRKGTNP